MGRSIEELQTECRKELELCKVEQQLIRAHCERVLAEGAAFGGEVALARRILAVMNRSHA